MQRRDFIVGLGGAAAWPMVARAQRSAVRVIGYLSSASLEPSRDIVAALHRGLADTGYFEGRDVAVEYRWADNHNDRLPTFALELVRRPVAVIIAPGSTPAAFAAKAVLDNSNRFFCCCRPCRNWAGCESGAARRKRHRYFEFRCPIDRETS